jgi:cyanophycinase
MKSIRIMVVLAVSAVSLACTSTSAPPNPPGAPPAGHAAAAPAGHLLIVGGGPLPPAVLARFVELAGGPGKARIVLFPMASSDPEAGVELSGDFRKMGAQAERIVLNHAAADTAEAAARLDGVTGIWFGGGDQALLTKALGGTKTEAAIHERYRAGAVVGGTSAGAAVMSTPMLTGDEKHPGGARPPAKGSSDAYMTIARDNVVTEPGFGLLPGAIVDQHFVRRRRNNRLFSLVLEHPALVGVGIDESTAVEVEPNGTWRILGASVAVVYDARKAAITAPDAEPLGASGVRIDVLPAGSRYDPRTGKAALPGR